MDEYQYVVVVIIRIYLFLARYLGTEIHKILNIFTIILLSRSILSYYYIVDNRIRKTRVLLKKNNKINKIEKLVRKRIKIQM